MTSLRTCPSCSGFVPANGSACPNCGASRARRARLLRTLKRAGLGLLGIAGGSSLAATLMACYGEPCADGSMTCYRGGGDAGAGTCADPASDLDRDGYCGDFDCNEHDPRVHARAPDTSVDGVDQDCDGVDGPHGPGN